MENRSLYIWIASAALLFYLWGWQSVNYNNYDRAIGSEFYFTAPMVYLTGITGNFAHRHIINKYGNIILARRTWEALKRGSPQVVAENVPCNERFVVQGEFEITSWGILKAATKPDAKYYVIKSQGRPETITMGILYEEFAEDANISMGSAICPDPFSH